MLQEECGVSFQEVENDQTTSEEAGYSIIYSFVYLSSVYFLSAPGGIPCSNLMIDGNVAFIKLVLQHTHAFKADKESLVLLSV